jgi:hypothetical protein
VLVGDGLAVTVGEESTGIAVLVEEITAVGEVRGSVGVSVSSGVVF